MTCKLLALLLMMLFVSQVKAEPALEFELNSPDIKADEPMSNQFTCLGDNSSPALKLRNIPVTTKSIAITMHSPDAPEGTWVHWLAYNLPADSFDIPQKYTPRFGALNDFGTYVYQGPCPTDNLVHHFVFRAYALDAELMIDEGMTMKDLERNMSSHTIAKSELVTTFRKSLY